MCGFCGFTSELHDREQIINEMKSKISHRGPNSDGAYIGCGISLGFKRLSIIDLSEAAAQPMVNEDGSVIMVFNGEVYNYEDLKDSLIKLGHTFKSGADSEVVLHLYEEYGTEFITMLRGMFAFTIWDDKNKLLFGARDYFGIKPYFYINDGGFAFASEIKCLLSYPKYKPELNHEALENYLTYQYSVLPETFFKGIFRLLPAHYFIYKDGEMSIKRYWEPTFEPDESMSFEKAVSTIKEAADGSIKAHMVSDVEVGSFLSSGVDSSYVAATFKGKKTFTVGFSDKKYNEVSYAKKLSSYVGIENYHKIITKEEYTQILPKVMYYMDEPLADPAAIALYFVSEIAAKHVKVALSGEGVDELFGGYNIYREPGSLSPMRKIPKSLRKLMAKTVSIIPFDFKGKSFIIRASKDVEERFIGNAYMFTKKERNKILKRSHVKYSPESLTKPFYDKVKHLDDITKMQYIDIHFWMAGDILLKADRMSMAHSLELRPPFLDIEVWKAASKIPAKFKAGKSGTKLAFRAAAKDRLPEEVADKKKLGFPVPIRVWLKEDSLYNEVKNAFENGEGAQYFNKKEIAALLDEHRNGKKDNSRKIWVVYMFLVWYSQFSDYFKQ